MIDYELTPFERRRRALELRGVVRDAICASGDVSKLRGMSPLDIGILQTLRESGLSYSTMYNTRVTLQDNEIFDPENAVIDSLLSDETVSDCVRAFMMSIAPTSTEMKLYPWFQKKGFV